VGTTPGLVGIVGILGIGQGEQDLLEAAQLVVELTVGVRDKYRRESHRPSPVHRRRYLGGVTDRPELTSRTSSDL
jgi:hypothetical protein